LASAIRIKLAAREQLRQLTRREQRYVQAALELLCKDDAMAALDVLHREYGIGFIKSFGDERECSGRFAFGIFTFFVPFRKRTLSFLKFERNN
jgi:hypothetical protein